MVAKKEKVFLMMAMFFMPYTSKTEVIVPDVEPVLEKHKICTSGTECVLIQRDCGDCDCGTPVNRKYQKKYSDEKKTRCANYNGGVCDLMCPTNESVCRAGRCITGQAPNKAPQPTPKSGTAEL